LEEEGGGLQAEEHHPNCEARGWKYHVVGVLCCRKDWCTSHHEDGKLCGYIEATSPDINQEVNAWSQWVFQMFNVPKHTSKVVAKCFKANKIKVF
jgi:hypothetical protein